MSLAATATLNSQLTSYARAHAQDRKKSYVLAERLCPTVRVPSSAGQFKQFNDRNAFRIYNTERALGGDPNRIKFSATDAYYNCTSQALEIPVDKAERQAAGIDNALGQAFLDEEKIAALVDAVALSNAVKRVNFVLANLTSLEDIGEWSNPDVDPIDQLDQVVDDLSIACGGDEFIKITMDRSAWRTLRNHPKSKARCNGVQAVPLSTQQVQDNMATPIDIGVFAISYDAAPDGIAADKKRLLAGEVIVHYSQPNPTRYDPSAFKCFTTSDSNIEAVRSYLAGHELYGGHVIDWSEQIVKTSSIAAVRITLS